MQSQDRPSSSRLRPQAGVPVDAQKRSRSPNLQLTGFPRFHPANFPSVNPQSTTSSLGSSPTSTINSPTIPLSPRQQYQYLHPSSQERRTHAYAPQRQLYAQQKDTVNNSRHQASHSTSMSPSSSGFFNPVSPRLEPCELNGPVTPLELEESDGYLMAGGRSPKTLSEDGKEEIVDAYIRRETSHVRPTSPAMDRRKRAQSPRFMSVNQGDVTRHRSHLSR